MIHYQLRCASGHDFEGWFRDSAAFDTQAKAGFVECPTCGATEVAKRLMAPAIPKKGARRRKEVAEPAAEVASASSSAPPPQSPAEAPGGGMVSGPTTSARNSRKPPDACTSCSKKAHRPRARPPRAGFMARPPMPKPRRSGTRASMWRAFLGYSARTAERPPVTVRAGSR
jgi:uncharacterized Zn finger protein (UPF0148 family)